MGENNKDVVVSSKGADTFTKLYNFNIFHLFTNINIKTIKIRKFFENYQETQY